jgi:hypothetical protein
LAAGLVQEAQRRLPQWADRIWVGNAVDWRSPEGQRFDYVHILLDYMPRRRQPGMIRHHLAHTVRPGTGRLLVSDYCHCAVETLHDFGFTISGHSGGQQRPGRPALPTAWIDATA